MVAGPRIKEGIVSHIFLKGKTVYVVVALEILGVYRNKETAERRRDKHNQNACRYAKIITQKIR